MDSKDCYCRSRGTFMGVPPLTAENEREALAAVLGIPFDCGTHPYRIGSRHGPEAIREQSRLVQPYQITAEAGAKTLLEEMNLVDTGDVCCRPGDINGSFPVIQEAVESLVRRNLIPITMGGDGAVTLPQLRALRQTYSELSVLHIDSHTDAYPIAGFNTASTFTRAAEEQIVDPFSSYHVGMRGGTSIPGVLSHTKSLGYKVITYASLRSEGITAAVKEIQKQLKGKKVYLCFDMDIFDPSFAPGVCTPEFGGLSAEEGLQLLGGLAGLDFVAFDVNTVSPPHDTGGMTALLAATVMRECCALAKDSIDNAASKGTS